MEANEETSEKENMKNRRYEERKKEKVEVGLVAARETEASGTAELAKWTTENQSTDPTIECGTCFSVSAEIFSLESPFPRTPKSGANARTAPATNCAACVADSENPKSQSRKMSMLHA